MSIFHAEAQIHSSSSRLHTQDTHQCWDQELLPLHHRGFLQAVSAHSSSPTDPGANSPWHQLMSCCSSGMLGRCMRLVLVLCQHHHFHAGNHSAQGKAIHVFLMCQNSWLYCRACYKDKRRCGLKTDLKYWAMKDKPTCCSSWINLPKRLCWIFQCDCDVAALTSRKLLKGSFSKIFPELLTKAGCGKAVRIAAQRSVSHWMTCSFWSPEWHH